MEDDPPAWQWIGWTLAYIAFALAITWFGVQVWPVLGPWVWSHI